MEQLGKLESELIELVEGNGEDGTIGSQKMAEKRKRALGKRRRLKRREGKKASDVFVEEGEVSDEEEVVEMEQEQLTALNQSLSGGQQQPGFDGKPLRIDTSDETKSEPVLSLIHLF